MLLQRIDASHPRVVGVDYDLGVPERVRLWVHFALGMTGARVAVVLPDGAAIGGDCSLPAAAGRFASCAFDVPPRRDLRLSGLGDAPMSLPGYLDGERYVSFGGRMILRGLQTCVRGSERIVDLTWLSARSLVDDYVVSVRVDDRAHDGVPALGALPTLKWFRGSIVDDRHPVVRSGASETGGVVVYDSAAGVDLPLLDERYDGRFTFGVP